MRGSRLRQLALITDDLEGTLSLLTDALGGAPVVERDPGVAQFGLQNGLIQVGDCFIEVVAPLPGASASAGARYLQRFGESGYMVLLQVPSLRACEEELMLRGGLSPIFASHRGERTPQRTYAPLVESIPDSPGITGTHFHPKDMGVIVELTESRPAREWMWAGDAWLKNMQKDGEASSINCDGIAGVVVACKNPEQVSKPWESIGNARVRGRAYCPWTTGTGTSESCIFTHLTGDLQSTVSFRAPRHPKDIGLVEILLWSRDNRAGVETEGVSFLACGVIFRFISREFMIGQSAGQQAKEASKL